MFLHAIGLTPSGRNDYVSKELIVPKDFGTYFFHINVGVICLVDSDNERGSGLLNTFAALCGRRLTS